MKQNLRGWTALAALLLASLNNSTAVWAEGSKQLTPNNTGTTADLTSATNTRAGYLIHDSNSPNPVSQLFLKPDAPDAQRMYVRMKPGETLYYGLQRTPTGLDTNQNDLIITVKWVDEFGVQQSQATTLVTATGTNPFRAQLGTTQNGVIDDAAQNQAGPKTTTNPTGYDALAITYPANQTGTRDYWVELTQVNEANLSADARQSFYDFWDFTVKNAADQEQKGRLFSKFWAFTSGRSTGVTTYRNRLSATFNMFTLVPSPAAGKYYVKQVELAGMRPLNFFFVANAKGSDEASTNFAESRKSKTGTGGYAEYLNFVNDPDVSLWPSAPVPLFNRTAQFFCNPLNGNGSAAFTTTSGESGSVNVLIDLNNNNIQDGNDVLLTQTVQANVPATLLWDGKNKANAIVAPGANVKINLSFTSTGAPVNYPLYDAEGNDDGLRVQNVRPSSGGNTYFDRLYWDDTNLPASLFPDNGTTPEDERVRLNGADSTPGVHRWGNASNDVGNNITINSWTYGFITPIDQTFTYEFLCDNDADLVGDLTDLDDDNDGVLDLTETFGVDPQLVGPSGVLVYLDAAYIHPVLGGYIDLNRDGINDFFDTDGDGVPNHFDLDADDDGIPDAVEANANVVPTYRRGPVGITRSSYSAAQSRYIGNVGANGIPNAAESNNTDSGTLRTALVQNAADDADSDVLTAGGNTMRLYNFLDIDSDNDGISDEIEFQTTAAYDTRKAQANFTTDTDRNGLRDAYDPGNGGTAIGAPVNSGGSALADMFDSDSDGDNTLNASLPIYRHTADWAEGFDNNSNGVSGDEILAKAAAFAVRNPTKARYYPVTLDSEGNASMFSPFLQDADANGIPNFLQLGNAYYHDDNFNGLADLYDPAYGGTPSTAPKAGTATEAAFRTNAAQVPLPVTLVSFEALAAGTDARLHWTTAQELNNTGFAIERSADGKIFTQVNFVTGRGTTSQPSSYAFTDKGAGLRATAWFYRLRQVDHDGTASFSPVRLVAFATANGPARLLAYPNPAHGAVRVRVLGNTPRGPLQLFDAVGHLVRTQDAPIADTEMAVLLTGLPAGIYVLRCGTLSQRIAVE